MVIFMTGEKFGGKFMAIKKLYGRFVFKNGPKNNGILMDFFLINIKSM